MGLDDVSKALKGADIPKFNLDLPKVKVDFDVKIRDVPRISELPSTVKVPELMTTHFSTKLADLPSSKDFPNNGLMKTEVSSAVMQDAVVKRIGTNAMNDCLAVKQNPANITKFDMDTALRNRMDIEVNTAKVDYKNNVKSVAGEVDTRLRDAGSQKVLDDLIESPDSLKPDLIQQGNDLAAKPEMKSGKGKAFMDKILQYGPKALMLGGLLVLLIPGGADAVVDAVTGVTEPITDGLLGVVTGIFASVFGPITSLLGTVAKPLLLGAVVLGAGYLLYKLVLSSPQRKRSPS